MHDQLIFELFQSYHLPVPQSIRRCGIGQGNYVYIAECTAEKFVVRLSTEPGTYENTVHWLKELYALQIPVPTVIGSGTLAHCDFLILTYIEGKDLGLVYPFLSTSAKQEIAREIVLIQNRAAQLSLPSVRNDWRWINFIDELLDRAERRILQNGHFDAEKVRRLRSESDILKDYFDRILPIAYLDDISSKNLLIHNSHISGIIDVDWIGIGDKLTFVALTNMALLNMECDTEYVSCILEEMHLNKAEQCAFIFYSLVYCVDFMGERGMQFMDKTIAVNPQIIARLNRIYDVLWEEWRIKSRQLMDSIQE